MSDRLGLMMGYSQGSFLHPPGRSPAGADGHSPASCLLARKVYINSAVNDTTAYCKTKDLDNNDVTIQVTFVVAHPPRISYFFLYCTGSEFSGRPVVVHTEGQLALLHIRIDQFDFYVYQPDGGLNGEPSLTRLPQPCDRSIIERDQIGFLPGGTRDPAGSYHVAALLDAPASAPGQLQFELYLFNAQTKSWKLKKPILQLDQQEQLVDCGRWITCKVITIGGDRGTMGFVDPRCGILFCNVLDSDCPDLHFVPLPTPLDDRRLHRGDAWRAVDVAVDNQGKRIRVVELDEHNGDTWEAATWSITFKSLWCQDQEQLQEDWRREHYLSSSQLVSSNFVELPPDNHQCSQSMQTFDLKRMYIELPRLSFDDDNTVYFLTKLSIMENCAWVLAVDMAKTSLQAVAPCRFGRGNLIFQQSKISNHPIMAAVTGTKGILKQKGTPDFGDFSQEEQQDGTHAS